MTSIIKREILTLSLSLLVSFNEGKKKKQIKTNNLVQIVLTVAL